MLPPVTHPRSKLERLGIVCARIERRVGPMTWEQVARVAYVRFRARDELAARAIWRRQGRALRRNGGVVAGQVRWTVVP
jgi:hypothetical protein